MRLDAGADRVANPLSFKAADVAAHAQSDLHAPSYGPANVVTFLAAVVSAVASTDAHTTTIALSDNGHTDDAAVAAAVALSVDGRADDGRPVPAAVYE